MTLATHRPRAALVIEADASIRGLLVELLVDADYEVLPAADGAAGLRLAREHRPSVIVLGLGFPPTSGLAVLDQLRRTECTRYIPVVVLTTSPPSSMGGDGSGPDSVLQMPFDLDELLVHLERTAALHQGRDEAVDPEGATPVRQEQCADRSDMPALSRAGGT